jgi:hypothetical protein
MTQSGIDGTIGCRDRRDDQHEPAAGATQEFFKPVERLQIVLDMLEYVHAYDRVNG